MTDQNSLLTTAKVNIRSVLLPAQQGLDLSRFLKEYRELIGKELPYRELGYQRVDEFLRAIPDVVSIHSSAGISILKVVSDERTAHIQKLVAKQKVSSKSRSKSSRTYRPVSQYTFCNSSNTFTTPPRFARQNGHHPVSASSTLYQLYRPPKSTYVPLLSVPRKPVSVPSPPSPVVPTTSVSKHPPVTSPPKLLLSTLNQKVSDLIQQHDDGLSAGEVEQTFKKHYGRELDFKAYDFDSLEDFLEQVPHLYPKKSNGELKIFIQSSTKVKSPEPPTAKSPVLYSWPNKKSSQNSNHSSVNYSDMNGRENSHEDNQGQDSSGISEIMKQQFREILRRNPRGIFVEDFLCSYRVHTSHDLNLQELGFHSLVDLVDALPDVFVRSRPEDYKNDKLFEAKPEMLEKETLGDSMSGSSKETTSRRSRDYYCAIVSNVRKILQGHPEGIDKDAFPHAFYLNCDMTLNIRELGFLSLDEFLIAIEDEVPLRIYDFDSDRPKIKLAISTASSVPSFRIQEFIASLYDKPPDDAVLPGAKYAAQILPSVPENTYFPIYAGTILTPSAIWIQLQGENTSMWLTKIMDKMENLYVSEEGKKYKMLDQHIVIGAVGAGVWDNDGTWYRICILSIEMDYIKATFVDYGNVGRIPKVALRYLKQEFLMLPAQAIKARMACIVPIQEEWTTRVRDKLLAMCSDKTLMAQVVNCPSYTNVVSLWLCDCSGDDEIYINKFLADEGYARICDDVTYDSSTPNYSSNQEPQFHPPMQTPSILATADLTKTADFLNVVCTLSKNPASADALTAIMQTLILNSQPTQNQQLPTYNNNVFSQPVSNALPFHYGSNQGSTNCTPSQQNDFFNLTANPSYNQQQVMAHLNSVTAENSNNSYARNNMATMQPPITSQRSTVSSDDYNELFDDDDEEFEKICREYDYIERYVKRVNFKFGYRIHIIALDSLAYVTSGDTSHLFWPTEDGNAIHYRLRQNGVTLNKKTIFEAEYQELFRQMRCLDVKGIREVYGKSAVTIFLLQDLGPILKIFGHPSPTICAEVQREVKQFDASSDIWNSFQENIIHEDDHDECGTDNDKFMHLCLYDLRSMMDGLKFQKVKFEKTHLDDPDFETKKEELKRQIRVYEERIKQIELYSTES